jgi:hypothetical protein
MENATLDCAFAATVDSCALALATMNAIAAESNARNMMFVPRIG